MTRLRSGSGGAGRILALAAAVLATAAVFAERTSTPSPRFISAPELAARIMRRDPALRVFDLRSAYEFEQFHVASARQTTLSALESEPLPPNTTVVLYGNGEARAMRAWTIARDRGADALVLQGGVREWFTRVYEPRLTADATAAERAAFEEASRLSRFFGGKPLVDVPNSQSVAAPVLRGRGC